MKPSESSDVNLRGKAKAAHFNLRADNSFNFHKATRESEERKMRPQE